MLGLLIPNPYGANDAPIYYAPKGDGWVRRAWRAMFGKRDQARH